MSAVVGAGGRAPGRPRARPERRIPDADRPSCTISLLLLCRPSSRCATPFVETPSPAMHDTLAHRFGTVEPQHLQAVQQALLDYVKREYVLGDAEGSLFCASRAHPTALHEPASSQAQTS